MSSRRAQKEWGSQSLQLGVAKASQVMSNLAPQVSSIVAWLDFWPVGAEGRHHIWTPCQLAGCDLHGSTWCDRGCRVWWYHRWTWLEYQRALAAAAVDRQEHCSIASCCCWGPSHCLKEARDFRWWNHVATKLQSQLRVQQFVWHFEGWQSCCCPRFLKQCSNLCFQRYMQPDNFTIYGVSWLHLATRCGCSTLPRTFQCPNSHNYWSSSNSRPLKCSSTAVSSNHIVLSVGDFSSRQLQKVEELITRKDRALTSETPTFRTCDTMKVTCHGEIPTCPASFKTLLVARSTRCSATSFRSIKDSWAAD